MNNVENIFEELKSKKLISNNVKLISNKFTPDFKAGLRNNKLCYNPSYSAIREDGIRFVLLHEIGHMQKSSIVVPAIVASAVAYLVPYFLIRYVFKIGTVILTIVCLVFFFGAFKLFVPKIKKEELGADSWAATKILENYKDKKPSLMLKQAMDDVGKSRKFNVVTMILRIIYKIIKYHPTPEERLQNVLNIENAS